MKKLLTLCFLSLPYIAFAQSPTFLSIPISDSTARGVIRGTLLLPTGTARVPVVLMIAGSGPTDRDGNNTMGITTNCTKMMAEALASQKIASVRFDKRGVGKSIGAMKSEEDLRFDDYIEDAKEWITMLRKDKRFSKIIVEGHSEGSLIGMIASQEGRADGFISLAGAGRPIDVVLNEQMEKNQNNPESVKKEVADILIQLKSGNTVSGVPTYLNVLFRASVQPYMISWLKYDPTVEIAKLKCPVLIVQGNTDIQVSMADAHALKVASPGATYNAIEGMNHVLKDAPTDPAANAATYANPNLPLSADLIPCLTKFITAIR